jgi:ABC-type dipeptide/oligopeptide/nickel transport system permease component
VTGALLEVEDVHVRLTTEDGILVAVFNLVVDLLYPLLDPRVQ